MVYDIKVSVLDEKTGKVKPSEIVELTTQEWQQRIDAGLLRQEEGKTHLSQSAQLKVQFDNLPDIIMDDPKWQQEAKDLYTFYLSGTEHGKRWIKNRFAQLFNAPDTPAEIKELITWINAIPGWEVTL